MMAKKEEQRLQFKYNLSQVRVIDFVRNIPKNAPETVGYSIEISHNYDKESEELTIGIEIIAKKSKKAKTHYCKLKTETIFAILEGDDADQLPVDFVLQSINIAYSTSRGILFAKNEDNFLANHPLTLIEMERVRDHLLSKEKEKNKKEPASN